MKGSGGTDGGVLQFGAGFLLAAGAMWLFFDSVLAFTGEYGLFTGLMRGYRGGHPGAGGSTTSMFILFVPFVISVITLFYDASKRWAWGLLGLGVMLIVVEILSHIRFNMQIKVSHLLGMLVMFSAGVGLMLRSYRDYGVTLEELERETIGSREGSNDSQSVEDRSA